MTIEDMGPPLSVGDQAESMAAHGVAWPDIAAVLGIDEDELAALHGERMEIGAAKGRAAVAEAWYDMATSKENIRATLTWLRKYGIAEPVDLDRVPTPRAADPVTGLGEIALLSVRNAAAKGARKSR
jgi:hypothetical protein